MKSKAPEETTKLLEEAGGGAVSGSGTSGSGTWTTKLRGDRGVIYCGHSGDGFASICAGAGQSDSGLSAELNAVRNGHGT